MLKVKLSPTGKKNAKQYRIVIAEERSKITGEAIDNLGSYNPLLKNPKERLVLNRAKLSSWISKGAQLTPTVAKLTKTKI